MRERRLVTALERALGKVTEQCERMSRRWPPLSCSRRTKSQLQWQLGQSSRKGMGCSVSFQEGNMLLKTISLYLDTRQKLEIAMSLASRLFGVVVSRQTEVELLQAAASPERRRFREFHIVCNRENPSSFSVGLSPRTPNRRALAPVSLRDTRRFATTSARSTAQCSAQRCRTGETTLDPWLDDPSSPTTTPNRSWPSPPPETSGKRPSAPLAPLFSGPQPRAPVFDFRAHFCHPAPMETHAFGFRLRANARRTKSDFLSGR